MNGLGSGLSVSDWIALFGALFLVLSTIVGTVWKLGNWISAQFSSVKGILFEKLEKLEDSFMAKLEYHEKHDDRRFAEIREDLWEIKIRNAARDGILPKFRDRDGKEDQNPFTTGRSQSQS